MSVLHTLLGLLDRQPNHGYDLKRAYDERFSFRRPLQFGQVYATLGRLERDRLVRVTGVGAVGGPERTTYAITGAGRDEFGSWLAAPEPPSPYLQPISTPRSCWPCRRTARPSRWSTASATPTARPCGS